MPNGDNVTLLMCGRVQRPSERASEPREPSQPVSQPVVPSRGEQRTRGCSSHHLHIRRSRLDRGPRLRKRERLRNLIIISPGSVKLQTLTFIDEERQLKMNGCFTRATN